MAVTRVPETGSNTAYYLYGTPAEIAAALLERNVSGRNIKSAYIGSDDVHYVLVAMD
jgi:hypothetical protein